MSSGEGERMKNSESLELTMKSKMEDSFSHSAVKLESKDFVGSAALFSDGSLFMDPDVEFKAEPEIEFKAEPDKKFREEPKRELKAEPEIEFKAEPEIEFNAEPEMEFKAELEMFESSEGDMKYSFDSDASVSEEDLQRFKRGVSKEERVKTGGKEEFGTQLFNMVGEKRKASSDSGSVRKRQAISFEMKVAIIKKLDAGERMVNVARAYNLNRSTIGTIYKQKDRIMEHVKGAVPMQSTIISKRRGKVLEEMEKLLAIWLEYQRQRRIPLSLMLIQEKAKSIFEDVKAKAGESAAEETFSASHGWFARFKKRANLHHVAVTGEAASADKAAAERFPQVLKDIIDKEGYSAKQVFNVDETGLFWKKMPEKTYISREEKAMPGCKVAKDRLTLMLGANADGTFKLKPLLVYWAANPQALKNVVKSSLPVIWMSNTKAWVTLAIFEDWFFHHFIPEVKLYCRENGIPFKILLVLDNAPGHPQHLDDFHSDVQVVYLPPNTTSLLQPMDQGVIANFKRYYTRRTYRMAFKAVDADPEMTLQDYWKSYNIFNCVKNMEASWREVSVVNLNAVWKPLCPQFVNEFNGFNQDEVNKDILSSLVGLSEKLELDLEEEDFEELLESHGEELTNEELMELEAQQRVEDEEEDDTPVPTKKFETKLLAEGFSFIDKAIALFEQQDPNIERCTKVTNQLNDVIQCYRIIYDEKKGKLCNHP